MSNEFFLGIMTGIPIIVPALSLLMATLCFVLPAHKVMGSMSILAIGFVVVYAPEYATDRLIRVAQAEAFRSGYFTTGGVLVVSALLLALICRTGTQTGTAHERGASGYQFS